jgi:hypothetical protein
LSNHTYPLGLSASHSPALTNTKGVGTSRIALGEGVRSTYFVFAGLRVTAEMVESAEFPEPEPPERNSPPREKARRACGRTADSNEDMDLE